MAWYLIPVATQYAGLTEANPEALQAYIELRQSQTDGGGSAFSFPSITDPSGIPMIVLTILVRPFPWEAHNLQSFIQAADGMLLLALIIWKIRRLGQAMLALPTNPYVTFILVYTVLFIIAFTTVANFGTLVRERAMLLPLFMMLLAFLPLPKRRQEKATLPIPSFSRATG